MQRWIVTTLRTFCRSGRANPLIPRPLKFTPHVKEAQQVPCPFELTEYYAYYLAGVSVVTIPEGPAFSAFAFLVAMVLSTQSSADFKSALRASGLSHSRVGALAVHQVQVRHGVIVVGAQLNRFLQLGDAVFDNRLVGALIAFNRSAQVFLSLMSSVGFRPSLARASRRGW